MVIGLVVARVKRKRKEIFTLEERQRLEAQAHGALPLNERYLKAVDYRVAPAAEGAVALRDREAEYRVIDPPVALVVDLHEQGGAARETLELAPISSLEANRGNHDLPRPPLPYDDRPRLEESEALVLVNNLARLSHINNLALVDQ